MAGSNYSGIADNVLKLDDHRDASASGGNTAYGGGSGGSGGPPVDRETKRYVDSEMRAVRAEVDAEFKTVLTKLDLVDERLRENKPLGFWALAGMGATGVLAIVTIFGVMADRFDGGIAARGTFDQIIEQQNEIDAAQNARLERIITTLETIGRSEGDSQAGAEGEQN